jgi:tRNA (mo5U34)-methyltransferase
MSSEATYPGDSAAAPQAEPQTVSPLMDPDDLRAAVSRIRWWHKIDLGHGIVTPGLDDSSIRLQWVNLPERLDGLTVLDVGAWDGFFSFEAERRGAARVLATDSLAWGAPGWGSKAGFELARRVLGSKVEDMNIDVLELSPERLGLFDVVLCLGVLYHMRDPLLALERVASVTSNQLILETHVEDVGRRPRLIFYPGSELYGDQSNWWGPNCAAVEALLRSAGFSRVQRVFPPSRLGAHWQLVRGLPEAIRRKIRQGRPLRPYIFTGRAAFHAWK